MPSEPDQPTPDRAVTCRIAGETPPVARTRARLGISPVRTGLEPAEIRQKRPANSRMESLGIQCCLADGHADLKAFRREVRPLSTAELRRRYPGEASNHANMLGRARASKAFVHPAYQKFKPFLRDMGPKPDPTFTVDRRDNSNPVYGPGLCVWRSPKDQARNRSTTIHLTDADGTKRPLAEWAEIVGEKPDTLRWRYRQKPTWPEHEVIHGRGAKAPSPESLPAPSSDWPALPSFRKVAIWDRAFGLFAATFPGPSATRAVLVHWFVLPHLRAHEDAYDAVHGWDHGPDEDDVSSPTLRSLRVASRWAHGRLTPGDREFVARHLGSARQALRDHEGYIDSLDRDDVGSGPVKSLKRRGGV